MGLLLELVIETLRKEAPEVKKKQLKSWYEKYAKSVFNTCLRVVNDREIAKDMVQESFIKAYNKIELFNEDLASPRTWLRSIAVNNCINHINKHSRILYSEQVGSISIPTYELPEDENRKNRIDQIKRSLGELPHGYRIVLSLYLFEGYDHREIAEILEISESTSKSQYSRAKRKLIEIMNSKNETRGIYKEQ